MAKTDGLDILLISGSSDPALLDDKMKALARQVAELLGVDHYLGVDGGAGTGYDEDAAGEHEQVTLHARISPNAIEVGKGVVFVKTVDSIAELFYIDENEAEVQMTRGGKLLLTKNVIANDTPLQADNAAGDGLVHLIKAGRNDVDDADVAMLPDATRLDSNADIPDEETALVHRKHVADEITAAALITNPAASIFGSTTINDSNSDALVKDAVYLADCDGLLSIQTANDSAFSTVLSNVGSPVNPPVDEVAKSAYTYTVISRSSALAVIRKGCYVKVTVSGTGEPTWIRWNPIGTGGLVKQ